MLGRVARYLVSALVASGGLLIAGSGLPASARSVAPTTLEGLTAVSCPSTSECWAGAYDAKGSVIIATTDGGAKWSALYTSTKFDQIDGIDCTSGAHCVALGDSGEGSGTGFLETTDGGRVWSTHAAPKSFAIGDAISCANGSDCWAIGLADNRVEAALARTTDGGAVWTSEPIPKLATAMSSPFGISCASSTDCLATGESALTTTNGGRSWTQHSISDAAFGPVTCPSTKDCYAIFDVTSAIPSNEQTFVYASTNGGATWKDTLSNPKHVSGLGGISCPTTSSCVAVGSGYTPTAGGTYTLYALSERTSNSAKSWTEAKVPKAEYLLADSCVVNSKVCIAVGFVPNSVGAILKTTNDGTSWTAEPLPKA